MEKNLVIYHNIHDIFASTNLTAQQSKKKPKKHYIILVIEDVCPLPGVGQNCPLALLLPHPVQIKDDLLVGGPYPTWISCKTSSCAEACVC